MSERNGLKDVKTSLLPFRLWVVFRLETSFVANPKDLLTLLCVRMHTPSRGTCWAAPITSFPQAWTLVPNRCIVIVTFIFPLAPPPPSHENTKGGGASRKGDSVEKYTIFALATGRSRYRGIGNRRGGKKWWRCCDPFPSRQYFIRCIERYLIPILINPIFRSPAVCGDSKKPSLTELKISWAELYLVWIEQKSIIKNRRKKISVSEMKT
jgi:hypothetical protein